MNLITRQCNELTKHQMNLTLYTQKAYLSSDATKIGFKKPFLT